MAKGAKNWRRYKPFLFEEQKGLCFYCGKAMLTDKRFESSPLFWTVDHKVPRTKGGTNSGLNLACACRKCNRQKKDMTVEEFLGRRGK